MSSQSTSQEFAIPLHLRTTESEPDKNGIITIVEYGRNEKGQILKITRKVKRTTQQVKVHKGVLERRNWKKFGDCENMPKGCEVNVTTKLPETKFELKNLENPDISVKRTASGKLTKEDITPYNCLLLLWYQNKDSKDPGDRELANSMFKILMNEPVPVIKKEINCRKCGKADHLTMNCPQKNATIESNSLPQIEVANQKPAVAKYIPVQLRNLRANVSTPSAVSSASSFSNYGKDKLWGLRISNLAEEVEEDDLRELASRFGYVAKVSIPREYPANWDSKKGNHSSLKKRGFAFIHFKSKENAENALSKLDKHRYANLILNVEWAKDKNDATTTSPPVIATSNIEVPKDLSYTKIEDNKLADNNVLMDEFNKKNGFWGNRKKQ